MNSISYQYCHNIVIFNTFLSILKIYCETIILLLKKEFYIGTVVPNFLRKLKETTISDFIAHGLSVHGEEANTRISRLENFRNL